MEGGHNGGDAVSRRPAFPCFDLPAAAVHGEGEALVLVEAGSVESGILITSEPFVRRQRAPANVEDNAHGNSDSTVQAGRAALDQLIFLTSGTEAEIANDKQLRELTSPSCRHVTYNHSGKGQPT